jgi:two-component system CheB/CheR fusion protein
MSSVPDLRIGRWLLLGFGAAAAGLVVLGALTLVLLGRISETERWRSGHVAPKVDAVERLETELLRLGIAARTRVISGDARSLAAYEDALARFRVARETYEALPEDGEGAARQAEVLPRLAEYEPAAVALAAIALKPSEAAERHAVEAAATERREAALEALRGHAAVLARERAEAAAAVESAWRRAAQTLVVATLAVLLILAVTTHLVGRGVRRPALALVEATRRLAAGDHAAALALASPRGDVDEEYRNELAELGRAFSRMALELQDREARILAQNEELQVQQEELQSQNEELQSQSEELASQTEQLRAHDERLRRSEERYRHLFEHLSEGFALHEMIWDGAGAPRDYRFLEVNPAFERITGLSRERAVGHTVRELLGEALEPEWIARYGEVVRGGAPARFEGWSSALRRHFEVVAFRPEEGQFATLFFDVTERRAAEEALRDADRRKDEFLAVLSHELRNPLAPIVSGLALMDRATPGSDELARARTVIRRQVGHLVRLVDDLLDVTRVTRGKVHLQRTSVDLAALVRHAAEDNAAAFAERGVALDVAVAPRDLRVDGDAARLAQVLGNLLQNAAKFTPRGGRVRVAAEDREGRAVITVRDTGIGIPPDVLPRLFQPFMQEERSLARTRGGLGLGLALVKGLVELHGGTVRVASAGEGCGSEFTVELPLAVRRPSGAEPVGRAGPRRRILLVEDNVDAAETLADVLRIAGHEVEVAHDGVEGIRRATALRPEAILCDIGLPGIDGYEVARRLRADGGAETFLVALTGYALPDDLRRAREAGFDAHLTKPAHPDEIEDVLARAGAGRPPAAE